MIRYGQPELEREALEAVRKYTDLSRHRLVVVDNYRLDMNLGALWNRLISSVKTPYVCLLNTDTRVSEGWLDRLIEGAEKSGADAVGPVTNCCGNRIQVGEVQPHGMCRTVGMLSGFCLVLRRDVWANAGGFREDFGFYGQESNLMERVGRKVIHPGVFVYHKGRGSFPRDREWDEEKQYSTEVYQRNSRFDWSQRLLVLGAGPGNPFPLWKGIDQAVTEFRRQGMEVEHRSFDGDPSQLRKDCQQFRPDVALIVCTNPTRLRGLLPIVRQAVEKRPVGLWFNDLRPSYKESMKGLVDRLFMCWSASTPEYKLEDWSAAFGCPVEYMPQGSVLNPYLKPVAYNGNSARVPIFIGGLYPGSTLWGYRTKLIEGIGARVVNDYTRPGRIKIEGQTEELYRSHHFCLSTSPAAPGYQSIRLYNILAYGGLALVDDFVGRDRLFTHGKHLLAFDHRDPESAKKVISEYEKQDAARERIRKAGWRLQQAKHNVGFRLLNMAHNLVSEERTFWGVLCN